MPGPAPKPQSERRTRHKPQRGDWQATPGVGWQHGEIPPPPVGLKPASLTAWTTWMRAWFAAHWTPADLPGLRTLILTYDQVERGEFTRGPELRILMDGYGITPKGQQDRRWQAPKVEAPAAAEPVADTGHYGHLRAVR